jgi:hypothetical protein
MYTKIKKTETGIFKAAEVKIIYMNELRQVNKQEFLRELKHRIEAEEITEEEIIILMRSYLLKEEEE